MMPDIRTLLLTLFFGNIFFALFLFFSKTNKETRPVLALLALAKAVYGVAYYLLYMRGEIADFWSINVANTALFVGIALDSMAASCFYGTSRKWSPYIIATSLVSILAMNAAIAVGWNVSLRILVSGACFILQLSVFLGIFGMEKPWRSSNAIMICLVCLFVASSLALRSISAAYHSDFGLFTSNATHVLLYTGLFLFMLASSIGILLLIKEKDDTLLKESEELYKSFFNDNAAIKLVIDPDSMNIFDANIAASEYYGFDLHDLRGMDASNIIAMEPAALRTVVVTMLRQRQTYFQGEHRLANGDVRDVELYAGPVVIGGKTLVMSIIHDVTDRKRAEELRNEIERIIQHDLKAPAITAINIATVLGDTPLNEMQKNLLVSLELQGKSMLDTINNSLILYKIETGKYVCVPEPVECVALIHKLSATYEKYTNFTAKVLLLVGGHERAPDSAAYCMADQKLFKIAMRNLLVNAYEASPPGGAVLINIMANERCRIQIINDGAVPQDVRERFFEKYVTQGKVKGTGLGTYSARMMVEAMGGEITMQTSDEDDKTIVTVSLPSLKAS